VNTKDLFEQAKQDIMRCGEYAPTMKVESDICGIATFEFEVFPRKTMDKQKLFFMCGRAYGMKHRGAEIRQIAFMSETWVSCDPAYDFSDEDPARREAIIIGVLNIDNKKVSQEMWIAEIVRAGDVVNLLPQEKMGSADNHLLTAFLAGFASAVMSDIEFAQFIVEQHEELL